MSVLRSRRLKWLGHVLTMPEDALVRRVMLRHEAPYKAGSVLADEAVLARAWIAGGIDREGTPRGSQINRTHYYYE